MDPLVTMQYKKDGRRVEGQASHISQFIESGKAEIVGDSLPIWDAWKAGKGKGKAEASKDVEAPPEDEDEDQEETQDIGLPLGYEIRRYGKWFAVYDPDNEKVEKAKKSHAEAVALARDHAGM